VDAGSLGGCSVVCLITWRYTGHGLFGGLYSFSIYLVAVEDGVMSITSRTRIPTTTFSLKRQSPARGNPSKASDARRPLSFLSQSLFRFPVIDGFAPLGHTSSSIDDDIYTKVVDCGPRCCTQRECSSLGNGEQRGGGCKTPRQSSYKYARGDRRTSRAWCFSLFFILDQLRKILPDKLNQTTSQTMSVPTNTHAAGGLEGLGLGAPVSRFW
jgi:hypothetical protein